MTLLYLHAVLCFISFERFVKGVHVNVLKPVLKYFPENSTMGVIREIDDSGVQYNTYPTKILSVLRPPNNILGPPNSIQHEDHSRDRVNNILACVGVVLGILVIVGVILCSLFANRRRLKRKAIASKYDRVFTTPRRPSPFCTSTTATNHNTHLVSRDERRSVYNALDLVTTKPQIDNQLDLKLYGGTTARHVAAAEKLSRFHSFEEQSERKGPRPLMKSKSAAALITHGCTDVQEQTATLSFNLKYVAKLRQLHLRLLGLYDLPLKTYGYDINATVVLFPRNTEGVHSRCVRGGKDVQFQETFFFDEMTLAEVEKATLRIVVNYRKKTKLAKEGFLGEMFVKCCDVDWTTEQPVTFASPLLKSREKNGSTVEKYLLEDLGALLICMEYQQAANRMKVMVRKGRDFPKSDKLIGRPGHYVLIHLLKNRDIVKVQETRSQNSHSPIWNQPFLFDVSGSDVSEYSLDFVLMREKMHTKNAVVGHVHIGANGSKSGRAHWKDIVSPRPTEPTRWHAILPVINFKESNQGE